VSKVEEMKSDAFIFVWVEKIFVEDFY
jgi:hypothetical protein